MDFNLENSKNKETKENLPEVKYESKQLFETEKNAENFDDCFLNEVKDIKANEVNEEPLEEAKEYYDDCEAITKEIGKDNLEFTEEVDDYSDCGKEKDDLSIIDESENENRHEEYEHNQEKFNIAHESVHAQQEAFQKYESQEETENNDNVKKKKGDIRVDDFFEKDDLVNKEAEEKISESANENLFDREDEIVSEEKVDNITEEIEKKEEKTAVEAFENSSEELDDVQVKQEVVPLRERIDAAFNKDEVFDDEIYDLRKKNDTELKFKIEEKEIIETELKSKFDEVLSKEKGSEKYKLALQEYNELQDKKANLSNQIFEMENQKVLLDKKWTELREVKIQNGVELDENNNTISKHLDAEYISMVEVPHGSLISEVNDGTDVPGKTDYFIEKAKAFKILSPFKQKKWENLSVQEQKQSIEKLADYNAEILGVKNKPKIVYYNAEDPSDYGGYSAKQNAIYINEFNMNDAAETADTISHEYRHKYQHERADKLENERDLEFKESFDNYIRPEDDYRGYKEQFVESDARDYAKAVKEKITSYFDSSDERNLSHLEQSSFGMKFSELNPKKGAVFEKVSVDELPEDFEKKDRVEYKETLEIHELDELRSVANVYYENGKDIWGKFGIQELESYKEHNDIKNGHIEKVRASSLEAADALETHFERKDYDGLFSSNIDRRTIEVMSIYHDTGMDGNIKSENYEKEREAFISDEQQRAKYVSDFLLKEEKSAKKNGKPFERIAATAKANDKFEREGFENHFRSIHSLESAIHALRDRESISKFDVNADEVALGCLIHSKSNSGLRNIASENDWRVAVSRLNERVVEFNQSHPNEQIYFDSSFLMNKDGSFKQDKLSEIRSEAIVLRIGDANGHDTNSRMSQTGKSIEFTLEQKALSDEQLNDFENKFKKSEYKDFFREVQMADVKVGGIELNNDNDPKGFSRMFAVGEGNFKSLNCKVDESGAIKQNFELCDGNAFTLSTQYCIEERICEYVTAHPLKFTPVVKLGSNCDKEAYTSYCAFADRIYRDYNIRMEVKR